RAVSCLTTISGNGDGRREEDEEVEGISATTEDLVKVDGSINLWPQDLGHLVERHLGERNVVQNHGAVSNACNRREVLTNVFHERNKGILVGDVVCKRFHSHPSPCH